MLSNLLKTEPDVTFTVARLIPGIVFFAHGAQKMLGWFGGYGFNGTMGFFMQKMGIPAPLAFLAICAEFFWKPWPHLWPAYPSCRAWHRDQHDSGHLHGAPAEWPLLP